MTTAAISRDEFVEAGRGAALVDLGQVRLEELRVLLVAERCVVQEVDGHDVSGGCRSSAVMRSTVFRAFVDERAVLGVPHRLVDQFLEFFGVVVGRVPVGLGLQPTAMAILRLTSRTSVSGGSRLSPGFLASTDAASAVAAAMNISSDTRVAFDARTPRPTPGKM